MVEDRHQKRLAEEIAERCFGVIDVHNQLRARHGLGQKIADMITGGGEREREQETAGTRGRTGRSAGTSTSTTGTTTS